MEKKFRIQPHQDLSKPTDAQVQQVIDCEDRLLIEELQRIDRQRMRHFAELLKNEPRLVGSRVADMDMSALEKRIQLKPHEYPSSNKFRAGGVVTGVVHRMSRVSDNLPRDHVIASGKRFSILEDEAPFIKDLKQDEDLVLRAMCVALCMAPISGRVGAKASASATRSPESKQACVWSPNQRNAASTKATKRSKLRAKSKAEKMARRKQR